MLLFRVFFSIFHEQKNRYSFFGSQQTKAHTFNFVCHSKSVMYRVLGIYNFDFTLIYKPQDAKKKHQGGIRPRSIIQRVFDLRNKGTLINHPASVVKKLRILKIMLAIIIPDFWTLQMAYRQSPHQADFGTLGLLHMFFDLRNKGTLINHCDSVVKKFRIQKIRLATPLQLLFFLQPLHAMVSVAYQI